VLLLATPLALALHWFDANPILVFAVALISIYPLAEAIAEATEALSATLGPTVGGRSTHQVLNVSKRPSTLMEGLLTLCGFGLIIPSIFH
jgi:hypothetical protein